VSSILSTATNSANFTNIESNINNNVQSTLNKNNLVQQKTQQQQQQQQQQFQQNVSHQQIFTNFVTGQQHPVISGQDRGTNMPKNEPVKLVYPTTQVSTIVTMNNNRVTFSSAPVQNGTITLSPMTANQLSQPNQQQQATVMQGRTASGQQAPTLIFKNANSSTPGTLITTTPVTMAKANSQVSDFRRKIGVISRKRIMNRKHTKNTISR
jgi:hypothetical protein